jgi:hypothetical protein
MHDGPATIRQLCEIAFMAFNKQRLQRSGRKGLSSVISWWFRHWHLTIRIRTTGPPKSWLDQLYGSGFRSGSGSLLNNHFVRAELSPGAAEVLLIRPPKVKLTPSGVPPVGQNCY